MFFKDFVSVKRKKIKKGASQTYDTPSAFLSISSSNFFLKTLEHIEIIRIFAPGNAKNLIIIHKNAFKQKCVLSIQF